MCDLIATPFRNLDYNRPIIHFTSPANDDQWPLEHDIAYIFISTHGSDAFLASRDHDQPHSYGTMTGFTLGAHLLEVSCGTLLE